MSSGSQELTRRPAVSTTAKPSSRKVNNFALVTQDHEQLSRVDLSGLKSPEAIRERFYSRAHIPDDDFRHCTIHLSSLDQTAPGTALDDSELWQICQGVISGEITPAPLFYVQLAMTSFGQVPSPVYPPSPYAAHPPFIQGAGSVPKSNQHASSLSSKSESYLETSSNSSASAGAKPLPHMQQSHLPRRLSPQHHHLSSPSKVFSDHQQHPSSGDHSRGSYHSPPLEQQTQQAYFDPDKRSSAGSVLSSDRLHPQHARNSNEYHRNQWEWRSSGGNPENERNHSEWLDRRPNNRGDRRMQSEAAMSQPTTVWEEQYHPVLPRGGTFVGGGYQPTNKSPPDVRPIGVGPSGPIYRPVQLQARSGRPRSQSIALSDHTARSIASISSPPQHLPNRDRLSVTMGPSGPLHFPQPVHHGHSQQPSPPEPSKTQPYPPFQAVYGHSIQGLQPTLRRDTAKSMDNLRNTPALEQHSRAITPSPNLSQQWAQYGSPPFHHGDLGRPHSPQQDSHVYSASSEIAMGYNPYVRTSAPPHLHQLSSAKQPQASLRHDLNNPKARTSPPFPADPNINSAFGAMQRSFTTSPAPLTSSQQRPQYQQNQRQPPFHARTAPQSGYQDRRPTSDYNSHTSSIPTVLQSVAGPQRIPLHPGETLQEVLYNQQSMVLPSRRLSPQTGSLPSPRLRQGPVEHQHFGSTSRENTTPGGVYSGMQERRLSQQQEHWHLAHDAQFTASPPAVHTEDMPPVYSSEPYSLDLAAPIQRHERRPAPQSPPMRHNEVHDDRYSSLSSGSSAGHQKSPQSSHPSATSEGHVSDAIAPERPQSYSSDSNNELQTPVSDPSSPVGHPLLVNGRLKTPTFGRGSPETHDHDMIYAGTDNVPLSLDNTTEHAPSRELTIIDKPISPSPYLPMFEKESETIRAGEWESIFKRISGRDIPDDGSTLGKVKEDVGKIQSPAEHSSTPAPDNNSKIGITLSLTPNVADPGPPSPRAMPVPAFHYNPAEDDDEDVTTWQVPMQPTKPVVCTNSSTVISVATDTLEKAVPKELEEDGTTQSLGKHDRPSLRVQTNVIATPVTGVTSSIASASPRQLSRPGAASSATAVMRTVSPRSAKHRSGQGSAVSDEVGQLSNQHALPSSKSVSTTEDASLHPIVRRPSFNTSAWAYRPPVEQVYENLEEFFPGHDLDKPIVDVGISGPSSAISSPANEQSPFISSSNSKQTSADSGITSAVNGNTSASSSSTLATAQPLTPSHPGEASRRFNSNRKSMRMVAQDRKSRLKREEIAFKAAAAAHAGTKDDLNKDKLARRKSTKMWGRKIEEVTSAEADLIVSAKTDSPAIGSEKEKEECEWTHACWLIVADDLTVAPIKWVKGELIGKGTYGHVYIGFNVTNGEMIAVKQVELPRTASDKDDNRQLGVVEALKSEMELLKDLEHEKIVSYLGFEESLSHLSILLEYVPGGSVGRCLRKHGKLEEQVVQFFTTQILEGLEYLHQRGILHRDLKADNILVKMDGTVKISDFGISKRSSALLRYYQIAD